MPTRPTGNRRFRTSHSSILAGVLFLIFPSVTARAHDSSRLTPPDGTGQARGEVRLSEDELRVRAEGLPRDVVVSVRIDSGTDGFVEVFSPATDEDGRIDVRARGRDGIPFDLGSGVPLAGREIVIVGPDDSVLLRGRLPGEVDREELGVGTAPLTPPEDSPFPEASGRIRVKAREGRHSLEVKVRGLADDTVYAVRVTAPDGTAEEIGSLTTNGGGNGALKIDTEDGGALPFGAGSIAEIAGFTLEVLDGDGAVVLAGTIPAAGERAEDEPEVELEFDLVPPEDSPEPDMEGDALLGSGPERDRVRVRIEDATPGVTYTARAVRILEDGSTEVEAIADLTADEDGKSEFEARGSDVLPFGATEVAELEGTVIEVVNPDGSVVLRGEVPEAPEPPPAPPPPPEVERLEFEVALMQPEEPVIPGAHGKVEFEEEDDEHEIEVEVQDLEPGALYRVELRAPDGAGEVLVEEEADGEGDLRRKLVFLGAEPLPFGAASFREYDGFEIAVLDADGALVLAETIDLGGGGGGGVLIKEIGFDMVGEYDTVFLRGDADRNFTVEVTDAVVILDALFRGGPGGRCEDALDANDDGRVDISDPITVLLHLFRGSRSVPYPGVTIAGFDRSADFLFCEDP